LNRQVTYSKPKKNMKNILLGLLGWCLTIAPTFAECADWHTNFFPASNTLPANGMVIFEGYGEAVAVALNLDTQYPIYLQAGKHKVRLKVKERNTGYNTMQVVLEPTEALKEGETYKIVVEKYVPKSEHHKILQYNSQTHQNAEASWTATTSIAKASLAWLTKPTVGKKSYAELGCGPVAHVDFDFKIKANSPYFLKATLTNLATKQTSSYIFEQKEGNSVSIGHSMCSGEFAFGDGKNYEITFELVDATGKIIVQKGKPIQFTKPS
jgi:hypothetical protein